MEQSKTRFRWWHAVGLVTLGFIVYCLIVPLFSTTLSSQYQLVRYWTTAIERMMDATIAGWFFVLGACLGSFLNVVIFRLPRGLPITGSSFCPMCRSPIRARDNVPLLAWLNLRGRCRDCGAEISVRYPLVETALGSIFFVLSITTIALAGWNLPVDLSARYGYAFNLTRGDFPLTAAFACHALLLTTLLAIALIDADGHRIPPGLVGAGLLATTLIVLRWPQLHFALQPAAPFSVGIRQCLVGLAAGIVAGGCTAISAYFCSQGRVPWRKQVAMVACTALVGTALGWSSLVVCLGIVLLMELVLMAGDSAGWQRWSWPLTMSLMLAALCFILCWRWLDVLRPVTDALPNRALLVFFSVSAAIRFARRPKG